jgi:serine/threonine protein phosphatase PrpC
VYSIYDGHGGGKVSLYLQNNFIRNILGHPSLISSPIQALYDIFTKSEDEIIKEIEQIVKKNQEYEKSGSCVLSALIINSKCHMAWVGDSRAIISLNCGKNVFQLTTDQKASNIMEQERIRAAHGNVIK